jgi:hypothetical protein
MIAVVAVTITTIFVFIAPENDHDGDRNPVIVCSKG